MTFVCWRHHNNVKLLFSVSNCEWTISVLWPFHAYINIPNYTTSNIRLNRNIFTAEQKETERERRMSWLLTTNQKTIMSSQQAHFQNVRCEQEREWELLLTIPQTCGSTSTRNRNRIHKCKRMRNFFGVPTREKTHVPFIMMFPLNFSIHRLMFFVLSGFLFLDTNCASASVIVLANEMCLWRFYMSSALLCCCLFSTAWLDASAVSSFSSKKIKSTEQMPLFRANPIVPLCNVYRTLHFEDCGDCEMILFLLFILLKKKRISIAVLSLVHHS